MAMKSLSRMVATALVGTAALAASLGSALAAEKVTFLTSWFAQAEHGAFYQAKATGLYEKAGLDVTIKMGGPQVNGTQLLLAGDADFIMGYDIQVLKGREQNLPLVTVASSFQFDLQAFFADKTMAQQAYPSSEPYQAEQQNEKVKFFLLADGGYPPYGSTIVTTEKMIAEKPDVVARFVKASLEGWRDYMKNPAPGNALIKADNTKMTDGQIEFALLKMKDMKAIDRGDAATLGVGVITADRYKQIYD